MKIDFHVHTYHSYDSFIRPVDLMRRSVALGVIPAVADHNSIISHNAFRLLGAPFIPAEEVRTMDGDLIALYLTEAIPKYTPFLETLDIIKQQGGISYLPHMYDIARNGISSKIIASKVDIIEVFNARCLDQKYNEKAKRFAQEYNLLQAVGSDSHFLFEFGKTYIELPDLSMDNLENPKALIKALKTGNQKQETCSAPFYVRGTTSILALGKKLLLNF